MYKKIYHIFKLEKIKEKRKEKSQKIYIIFLLNHI